MFSMVKGFDPPVAVSAVDPNRQRSIVRSRSVLGRMMSSTWVILGAWGWMKLAKFDEVLGADFIR